ncbi:hypothetical protein DFH29DRAFT_359448 [Suillus ampliporus]|nr:hypothetical protein DFH29DRAFT_359448 [Suillus ampliporus]
MGVLNHFDQFGTKNSQESVLEPTLHGTIRQALPRMDRVRIYPRFRLLIIGNTGVGKSSLIYAAFRINKVHILTHIRGRADIDTEFIGPGNEQIVLHDSEGFEGRDSSSFQIAKEFIRRRREMPGPNTCGLVCFSSCHCHTAMLTLFEGSASRCLMLDVCLRTEYRSS